MTAYDPTSGELRTHYAGFFDPGFGYDAERLAGSRAALEVRAHDVPFMIEHGQRVCKLTFERMFEPPDLLYGARHRLLLPGPGGDRWASTSGRPPMAGGSRSADVCRSAALAIPARVARA